jgi:glucose-1-phosphate adenylyltransferase
MLAMVLAGGRGERLDPLTRDRAKPAVPFGGRYRIIDFVLSNFANSGVLKIKVLTQYKSDSLNRHINRNWRMAGMLGHYVETVPAQMRTGPEWYKGSADAIFQSLNIITEEEPDLVLVFGGDNIYRMDVRQMLEYHQDRNAECTVAAIPVPIEQASNFGIIEADAEGRMIGFVEKPAADQVRPMPRNPKRCLASMGNYIFSSDALVKELVRDAASNDSAHDFGSSIIAQMYERAKVCVYDFTNNVVPGQSEKERAYWRDVGTIDSYFHANFDLIQVEPVFNLYNDRWPVYTAQLPYPPAKFVFSDRNQNRVGNATDSLVSEGCIISGGQVHKSILSPRARVNSFAWVEESILFENVIVGRGCRIRRAIIDKNVDVPANTTIGYDLEQDRRRFHVTESGIVVIPKGMKVDRSS